MVRAVRDRDVGKWAVVAAFPLIYFPMVASKQLIYARYLLPILPFLCLSVAFVVVDVVAWIVRWKQPLGVRAFAVSAFSVLVLLHPVRQGIDWPRQYGGPSTQDAAYRMIQQSVPKQSKVAIEQAVLRLPDSAYRTMYVHNLTDRSLQEYVSSGVTFLIASLDRPDRHPDVDQAYRRLLDEAAQCLPTIEPTAAVSGPAIRICRLRTY
jgi:membrane protein implicated in regulation of membrane protease activity